MRSVNMDEVGEGDCFQGSTAGESQHGIVGIRIIYLIRNVLLHGVADDTGVADGAILLAPS